MNGTTMLTLNNSLCTWEKGALSFVRNDDRLGWRELVFRCRVDGERFDSRAVTWRRLPSSSERLVVVARPDHLPLEVTLSVTAESAQDRLLVQCRYRNRSWRTVRVDDIVEGAGQVLCSGGRAFHIENVKQMFLDAPTVAVPEGRRLAWGTALCGNRYWAELGRQPLLYGSSEDQPYPAVFLASAKTNGGLVDAQFSQERWYRDVHIGAGSADSELDYTGAMTTRGVRAVKVPPGGAVDGEVTWLQITSSDDLRHAFSDYNEALLAHYDFRPLVSPNRGELIWGSWNLGIWDNCTDDLVVGNAKIIKEQFPSVRWVQIDEGWAGHPWGAMACPLYEGALASKFPRGLKAVADDIKSLGLRPALWCGMHIKEGARVLVEHPEWLLRNRDGTPHTAERYLLDYSREDVRDFLVRTYQRIIREWGYEGIKLDFWTYGFEDHGIVYQNDDQTSLQLRNWWLRTLRELLPEDGYLQPGCNLCSISPFVTMWSDNVRYGVDVGEGDDWQAVIDSAVWLAALSLCEPGRMWLPNSDAIGSMKRMDEAKRRTWLSFCAVTNSALELGADLRQEEPADWEDAKRILANLGVGEPFVPVDFGLVEKQAMPPRLWFTRGGAVDVASPTYAGMFCAFNWEEDTAGDRRVTFQSLGLDGERYRLVNYWNGEEKVAEGGIELPQIGPHDVYAVRIYTMP